MINQGRGVGSWVGSGSTQAEVGLEGLSLFQVASNRPFNLRHPITASLPLCPSYAPWCARRTLT